VLIDFSSLFISLFSIEMLSDCVISGLYMRVLKLTWKNLISVNFLQFSDVSMWSVRTVFIGVRTDKWSGRYSLGVRTGMEPNRLDGTCLLLDPRSNHRADG